MRIIAHVEPEQNRKIHIVRIGRHAFRQAIITVI